MFSAPQTPQQKTVTGVVTEAQSGEPLFGCSVVVKGTTRGVSTDMTGRFEIQVAEGETLQVSYVGYVTREIKIGKANMVAVELSEDSELLEEVVVTAFGTGQRKESVTGSVQAISPGDLKIPASNLSNAFAGRMSGVVAYQRSGEPGSNASDFFIRGISTLSGVTSPLIVLDGVEISAGDLNALDPDIIESFSILKDATATAMYGTRGANGVMIVKTKSGSDLDRPQIGLRFESYVNMPTKVQKFVDGATYMELFNEAVTNQNTGTTLFTQRQIDGTRRGLNPYVYPNVDWYNEIFKDITYNQKANFNIRGGTSKITYFMNLNVNHESGMLKDNSKRYYSYGNNISQTMYTFQNNIDFHLSPTSTISLHLNAKLNDYTGPSKTVSEIFSSIMGNNPVDFPISFPYNADGEWVHWGGLNGGNNQAGTNPMAEATLGYQDRFASTVIANLDFDQKLDFITKGLSFKLLFSFKNWSQTSRVRQQSVTNRYFISPNSVVENPDGTYDYEITPLGEPDNSTLATSTGTTGDRQTYIQAYLNYDRSFGNHNVGALVLFNADSYRNNNPGGALIASLPKRKMGFAARLSYDYAHRYLLEINAGYNGSENFAAGHRWGFFPSVSVGWNISQEPFWESLRDVVSNFKLRGSYGLVGNDQIGSARFIYLAQVTLQSAGYTTGFGNYRQGFSGPVYNRYQNDDITWEIGRKLNVGIDLQLFHSLNVTLEGFREIRSNIFQETQTIPDYFGTANSQIFGNLAKVQNWGIEVSADYAKQISKDLFVSFKGTFSFARNTVLEYDEGAGMRPALSQIGKSLNTYMGFVSNGLYIDQADIDNNPTSQLGNIAIAPGDLKYRDQPDANGNYDGIITMDDRVPMGFPTVPEIIYGFGPSISYKNWDFSFFFQGAANTSLMINAGNAAPFGEQQNRNVLQWIADSRWNPADPNPHATYPRLTKYANQHNNRNSDYWLRDGSFLKLKNIEVGYTYKRARIYLSAVNVATFSSFKLWDPEMGGGAALSYPTQRTINLGVQLKL